ncbi:2-C-methyl-D-erythritol 4-phosphate cytidylyltransferase [Jiangella ureilytica]|uniref:2-C-methyl-D-erythritol 4-phosphate cytidylyltransferase n=1 Tax=Jiangella ureilytica TaxID=2530374 RepID=A0A4R4RCB1_9ACTN|nr:2-C-methyl-D-erythritol 4-phosphate cytidylyltransferase [Jiangella ureilytica]TDC46736.1 2-C-methyl-D-erythritol 4-phosphate cytidylyltransferase [Jiangella ureilytica]
MSVACIVVAAGRGERLGEERPKAFVEVGGRPLVWHALQAAARSARVSYVVVVAPGGFEGDPALSGADAVVPGGATRQHSVANGLAALPPETGVVLIHDAARCLAPPSLFDDVAAEVLAGYDAVIPGLAVVDTLKVVDGAGRVTATPDRSQLRAVQTPQGFARAVIDRAHAAAVERGDTDAPDDASLVERLGLPVHVVAGHADAFKVTRPQDLLLASTVLARRAAAV